MEIPLRPRVGRRYCQMRRGDALVDACHDWNRGNRRHRRGIERIGGRLLYHLSTTVLGHTRVNDRE